MNQVEILETPVKSENDKKQYRLIKLHNGLKALLIQTHAEGGDSDENRAAASLMVSVGSFDEPREIGGLAHFLEHAIFMGNQKYPGESGFNDFVSANGGRRNAMTSDEFTLYFFDAFEEAFEEALDRFANMFISPLLLQNAMQREREAVDSEYKMALSSEGARILGIFKLLIKESHPASQFDFGNLKTLKDDISDDNLHAALLEIYKKYVANKMYVCVQSKRSLDEIQAMVVEKFSPIRSGENDFTKAREFDFNKIVKPEFCDRIFYVKPRIAKKALVLTWVLPPQVSNYKCKPLNYVTKLFENNGEGGIASWLKERNLTINCDIHAESEGLGFNHDFSVLRLAMELTDNGMENVETILSAIFSYLLMIKEAPIEEHRRIFEQEQRSNEISFKFHQETSPISNVRNYGSNFLYYDDIDLLQSSLTPDFNENAIMEVINRMNEMRFNVMFLSDKYGNYVKRDPYFETDYDDQPYPESYKVLWQVRKLNDDFYLPRVNPFEATNFTIKVNDEESPKYPVKILDNDSFEVWHKLDNKFKVPKVRILISLISPKHLTSVYNYLLLKMFDNMYTYHSKKKFAQAFDAEIHGDYTMSRTGGRLTFRGYNDKIELFIEMFIKELKNIPEIVNESIFEQFRNEQKEEFISSLKSVRTLASEYFGKLMVNQYQLDYDMYKLMDQISYEDVQKILPKVLKKLKFKVLSQGNITREETLRVVNILDTNIDYEPHDEEYEYKRRGYQMPRGVNVLRIKSLLPNDDNSYIKNFYQIGMKTKKNFNMSKMLKKLTDPKVYDILRSKQQLGYAVGCSIETYGGVLGFSVTVMSQEHKHKFTDVEKKITDFMMTSIANGIDDLTDEEFEKLKEAHIKELQTEILSLSEESSRNWEEIIDEFYMFTKNEIYADVTKQITKSEFQEFFHSFTDIENQRSIHIQVIGNEIKDGSAEINDDDLKIEFMSEKFNDYNVITDIEAFQRDLHMYPELKAIE